MLREDIRFVNLIGPPGIGKTRLSIESARASLPDFPDGVFFVALAPLYDPALIAITIAQALGYVAANNISTSEQLKEGIGEKQMLIVLDNCEHLIEDVAPLASFLLSACSRLKILATSRESLRIPGEWLYPVPTFDVPSENSSVDMESAANFPALTLFVERARAVRPDFVLNIENIKTVSAICAHLDRLPLVIELIAARMRLMSSQALLDRLSGQFILSADGMRAASARQKTLNDAIAWSYNLLSSEEQKLFAYLSVYSGGFTLAMAEAMFSDAFTEKLLPYLFISLSDKSLLQRVHAETGETRYTMLATIQEFARNRLQQMGEEIEIRNRHLAYFLNLTANADKDLRGPNQLEWLRRLGDEVDNLRTALEWAIETVQTEKALQLVRKLDWFWFIRADHTEARQWHNRVLEMPDTSLYPAAHAEVLYQLAHHTWLQVGADAARPITEEALSIARSRGDKHNSARALSIFGLILADEQNFAEAQSVLEESKALYEEVHDVWGYAHVHTCLGQVPHLQGDRATALALRESALALFRKLGDNYFVSSTLGYIGLVKVGQGDLKGGVQMLQESLLLSQRLDSKLEIAFTLRDLIEVAPAGGDPARAVRLFFAAQTLFDMLGTGSESYMVRFADALEYCRTALGESVYTEAIEQGRAMMMEQAIAYTLEGQE